MSPSERLELAFRLGDEAVAAFALVHGIAAEEAVRELARRRRLGRRRSGCIESLSA
jgi:hypothetical protein